MSLYDRPYMRERGFRVRRSLTVDLIILNAIIFILQSVCLFYNVFPIRKYFYLSLQGLESGYFWQLITFQFLHSDIFHILINCFVLYFFGRAIEDYLGRSGFLKLYLLSGVIGGILQILFGLAVPMYRYQAVVGASAGVFGLVAAFATLFPEQPLTTLIAFIIPVTMRAKYLLLIEILITIYGLLFPSSPIANAAHLGGIITGIVYIRWGIRFERYLRSLPHRKASIKKEKRITVPEVKTVKWEIDERPEDQDLPAEEFMRREVDPILDKIAAHGIQSLTEKERKILEAARQKMNRQ